MSSRRSASLVAVVALLSIGAGVHTPASAAPKRVDAQLRVAEGYYPATRSQPYTYTSEACQVTVRERVATAHDVLEAGFRARCISSYELVEDPSYGSYVRCIEGRCEATGFYWAVYRNAALACEGIDAIEVRPGDEITFSYEAYPTALVLATCGSGA
jgi:hypothetical protein